MKFAFADGDPGYSKVTVFGAPYDLTSSFRPGSRFAPQRIRENSFGFESYIPELDLDLTDYEVADEGDLDLSFDLKSALMEVYSVSREMRSRESIPFMLGGEHSLTPGNLRSLDEISVLVFDAHLDYKKEYMDSDGHACVLRRVCEECSVKKMTVLGVRSFSKEEFVEAKKSEVIDFYPPGEVKRGLDNFLSGAEMIYISMDMDVVDPAYAPGVGNPEPGGITPSLLMELLSKVIGGKTVAGLDLVEISPPFDCNDMTSLLGAWLVKETIGRILAN